MGRIFIFLLSMLALAVPARAIPYRYHWECVPFAREMSGVQIYGNALTWWGQAEGKYARGNQPRIGAVLAFKPHGRMRLGHVAAVTGIVDTRTIKVTHANWSPINGRRGQIEEDVEIIDVSENNDWSRVRVWFAPTQALGGTAWPVHGFIYGGEAPALPTPTLAPRLDYASLDRWDSMPASELRERRPARFAVAGDVRPTGRLAYLETALRSYR